MAFNQDLKAVIPGDRVHSEFLLYALQANKHQLFQNIGRSAHGTRTLLSEDLASLRLTLPPKAEQRAIAAALGVVRRAIETEDGLIAATRELKRAAVRQLFTRGVRGERQKETEIGPVPESWQISALGTVCQSPQYGVTASAQKEPVGPKFLRITDLTDRGVDWDQVPYCTCADDEVETKGLLDNDIVFARIGATTGKSYIVKNAPFAVFASYLIRVRTRPGLNAGFLYQFFQSERYWEQINANKRNSLKGGVNSSILSRLRIALPALEEQEEITQVLEVIDAKIVGHKAKRRALNELFDALLHDLMTGHLRVDDLDLTALESRDGSQARAKHRSTLRVRVVDQSDDGRDNDMAASTAEKRLGMMWQLARDAWAFTTHPERAESRLQRHVVRTHRRER